MALLIDYVHFHKHFPRSWCLVGAQNMNLLTLCLITWMVEIIALSVHSKFTWMAVSIAYLSCILFTPSINIIDNNVEKHRIDNNVEKHRTVWRKSLYEFTFFAILTVLFGKRKLIIKCLKFNDCPSYSYLMTKKMQIVEVDQRDLWDRLLTVLPRHGFALPCFPIEAIGFLGQPIMVLIGTNSTMFCPYNAVVHH